MAKRILELALETMEKQKATVDAEIAGIHAGISRMGRREPAGRTSPGAPKRRTMSAVRRKAVSRRMKAYWAARKAQAAKPKRGPKSAAAEKAGERMKAYRAKKKAAAAK